MELFNNIQALDSIDMSVSELKNIKKALDESSIVAVTDPTGIITAVNDRFCQISKYSREELIGQDHRILNSGIHSKLFFREMWRKIGNGETWHGEICNRTKDNSYYWVQTTIVPFLNDKGKPYQYISIRTDITAQKNIKQMTYIAYHDDLTGLPNRRSLLKELEIEIAEAEKAGRQFALFLLDINRFKNINDGLGHKAGDVFLQEIAGRLIEIDQQGNSFYRLNGDEFVYVLKDIRNLEQVTQNILQVFKSSFLVMGHTFFSSTSIGISLYPDHAQTSSDLLKSADFAMYEAKKKRGNYSVLYQPSINGINNQQLKLETKLHQALLTDSFYLHYQPKVQIETGEIEGMEALLRWHDEELGYVPPDQFIPFAEDCGLIGEIGEWVLRQAGLQVKQWNEQFNLNLRVAVNISPKHLGESDFLPRLKQILLENDINPQFIELEITEMSMVDQNEDLVKRIHEIKAYGMTISVDDFGTGYSSLSYLKGFPVDALKIDRSFIQNIGNEQTGIPMVEAIIKLAHALNMTVVAEGVEEMYELEVLKQFSCEYIQGYLFSKPLSAEEFAEKLFVLQEQAKQL